MMLELKVPVFVQWIYLKNTDKTNVVCSLIKYYVLCTVTSTTSTTKTAIITSTVNNGHELIKHAFWLARASWCKSRARRRAKIRFILSRGNVQRPDLTFKISPISVPRQQSNIKTFSSRWQLAFCILFSKTWCVSVKACREIWLARSKTSKLNAGSGHRCTAGR